ncbi:hypothetical protein [Streptomyces sp. NPDC002666]
MDWKTRAGEIGPELPATLGWVLSGVVTAANHPGYRPGGQAIAMSAQIATGRGTWAERFGPSWCCRGRCAVRLRCLSERRPRPPAPGVRWRAAAPRACPTGRVTRRGVNRSAWCGAW